MWVASVVHSIGSSSISSLVTVLEESTLVAICFICVLLSGMSISIACGYMYMVSKCLVLYLEAGNFSTKIVAVAFF